MQLVRFAVGLGDELNDLLDTHFDSVFGQTFPSSGFCYFGSAFGTGTHFLDKGKQTLRFLAVKVQEVSMILKKRVVPGPIFWQILKQDTSGRKRFKSPDVITTEVPGQVNGKKMFTIALHQLCGRNLGIIGSE